MKTESYLYWEGYFEILQTRRETKGQCEDGRCYLPSPDEIAQRKNDLDWLKEMGFGNAVIESVMQFDQPTIDWIDRQINVRGKSAEEITERIKPFLICIQR